MDLQQAKSKYNRFNTPGDPHFLTFRCYRNRKFLKYDRTRKYVVRAVLAARYKHRFDVWAYVIMPDHLHLLIAPDEENYSMSEILKSIKQPVARKAINYLKENRSAILRFLETGLERPEYRFWQDGGGYDRNVDSAEVLGEIMKYIHLNPVTQGLVENSEDWCWSSANEWINDIPGPISIDKKSFPIW
jgi:putative transposase